MNVWIVYGIIIAVGVALIAGIVVASMVLWRRQVQRSVVSLVGRREAIVAAYKGLESVFASIAEADEDEITAFAVEPGSVHRKALEELHARMRIQADELATVALPKDMWKAADLLGTAAAALAIETGRVGEATSPEGVLDALGAIDVTDVKAAIEAAGAEVGRLSEAHHVEADPSVYGGGLYI